MITKEEKLLILLKHQPYMTEFDLNEYEEIYFEGSAWGKQVPYKPDGAGGLRRFTFSEYVDYCMSEDIEL